MFCNFCKKSNMAAIFGKTKFFANWDSYSAEIPFGSKISSKLLYLARLSRYKLFYDFCEKFENSKWPSFLARQKYFQDWDSYSAEIPCGSKISSKLLYLAQFLRYKRFYGLQFLRKIRKFKMAVIFGERKYFQDWDSYSAEIPCGLKILSKSFYLARFSRYKHFCVFLIWKIHND